MLLLFLAIVSTTQTVSGSLRLSSDDLVDGLNAFRREHAGSEAPGSQDEVVDRVHSSSDVEHRLLIYAYVCKHMFLPDSARETSRGEMFHLQPYICIERSRQLKIEGATPGSDRVHSIESAYTIIPELRRLHQSWSSA